jgi:transcription initiation factor IIE alpha subunit
MNHYGIEETATLPLFTQRAPSVNGSMTSAQAAESMTPKTLNALQRQVLTLLQATPAGLTDEQMQTLLAMNPSTQRPRRIELARRGLIVTAGTRKTKSGRMATTWRTA